MNQVCSRRGLQYRCLPCQSVGVVRVDRKNRLVDHVLKHHVRLDEVPFYCTLCLFRCTTQAALHSHITGYQRHVKMSKEYGVLDHRPYLIQSGSPINLEEGFIGVVSREEAALLVKRKAPETDEEEAEELRDILDMDLPASPIGFDTLSFPTAMSHTVAAPTLPRPMPRAPVPSRVAMPSFTQTSTLKPAETGSVHLTSTLPLTTVFSPPMNSGHIPPVQVQGPYTSVPAMSTFIQPFHAVPLVSSSIPFSPTTTTTVPTFTQAGQPALQQLQHGVISPALPVGGAMPPRQHTVTSQTLTTPKLNTVMPVAAAKFDLTPMAATSTSEDTAALKCTPVQDEDILGQLLGKEDTSFILQTEAEAAGPAERTKTGRSIPRETAQGHTSKSSDVGDKITEAAKLIADALDKNARAIRCQGATLVRILEELERMNRTMHSSRTRAASNDTPVTIPVRSKVVKPRRR